MVELKKQKKLFALNLVIQKKRYVVYTKNEIDENGNVTIYVSEMVTDKDGVRLTGVETDEEWSKIKDVLRELAKNEG